MPTPKVDANHDGVFDDLATSLAGKRPDHPVHVIVTLKRPASSTLVRRIERRVGRFSVHNRFQVVDAFAARVQKRQVDKLAERPDVASVEADDRVRVLDDTGEAAFGVTEARHDNAGLDGNHDGDPNRYSRGDMVAAVLDTGIDARHADLDGGKVLAFVNCVTGRCYGQRPFDNNGHGTHVSGILAGDGGARPDRKYAGVAPKAALVGVKVLGADGRSSKSAVIAGIDWTIRNRSRYGIEALNMSVGAAGCYDGTDVMSRAADQANAAGLVTVAAAGNEGPATCTVNSPAAGAGVLAVGGMVDIAHGGFLADWISSRGRPGGRTKPDVLAPSRDVMSAKAGTRFQYVAKTGTSMASPFVTGTALLMRDANPSLTPAQVKTRIRASAVDWGLAGAGTTLGSRGPDLDFGWGRLDAYAALRAAGAPGLSSPPPVPDHRTFDGSMGAPQQVRDFPIEVKNRCLPIAASVIMPRWRGYDSQADGYVDYDIKLLDASKNVLAKGDSIERQDDYSYRPPSTGTYVVRVEDYTGSGPFFADVSAGLSAPPPGSPASCGPPSSP